MISDAQPESRIIETMILLPRMLAMVVTMSEKPRTGRAGARTFWKRGP